MSVPDDKSRENPVENTPVPNQGEPEAASGTDAAHTSYEQTTDHDYDSHYHSESSYEDPYTQQSYGESPAGGESTTAVVPASVSSHGEGGSTTPPTSNAEEEDD